MAKKGFISAHGKKIAALVLVGIIAWTTMPYWGPFVFPLVPVDQPDAIPVFKLTNICTDAAVTAAPTVKLYDAAGRSSMPTTDIAPMQLLDTLSETPDILLS